jgi:hypothetical protein
MNKDEIRDLFQEQLSELEDFEKEIKKIRDLINLIIENFDLLKDDVTEEQIGEVSSDVNVKLSKVIALVKDILSDSKKLESFIHEIKLLKRKREKKLAKGKVTESERSMNLEDLLKSLGQLELEKIKKQKYDNNPINYPYTKKYPPNKWDVQF